MKGINQDVKVKCAFYIVHVNIQAGLHVLSKTFAKLSTCALACMFMCVCTCADMMREQDGAPVCRIACFHSCM